MARKKKEKPVTPVPEEKKEGEEQMQLDMPIKAAAAPQAPSALPEEIPSLTDEFSEILKARAKRWAIESGLKEPFYIAPPELVKYPLKGWGYSVIVNELSGKQRYATARFDKNGNPTYWTIEGLGAVL